MAANAIRNRIKARLKALGWTRYRLAKALKGKVPASCVYSYLAGERELTTDTLTPIMEALDLEITERKTKRNARRAG